MKKYFSLLLIFFVMMLTACSSIIETFIEKDVIKFGTGTFEDGIEEHRSTFSQDEDFLLEVRLSESFGTSDIRFVILKSANDSEEIYEEWYTPVDPTWSEFLYEFHLVDYDGTFDTGDYIVRMFTDQSELIAEGAFTIE